MENYMVYLVKATICLITFSVFFRLLLMRETFFRFTRFTLISGLIVCSVLPFVNLKLGQSHLLRQTVFQLEESLLSESLTDPGAQYALPENERIERVAPEVAVSQDRTGGSMGRPVSPVTALIAVYWLGVGVMLLRLGASFISLYRLFGKSGRIESEGYKLVISPGNIVPFSFFRYIVLSEKDYLENPDEIILHEKMHIRQKHNIDVFFSELFLAVHWFNPMVWLLCRDLREIHEYEADNAVIEAGIEAQKYQLLLVKKAVGERRFTSVVNGFNQSKIKNRIAMMLKTESSKWARLKVLVAVPLAVVALLAFSRPESVEDQFVSYPARKAAVDYFLSVRRVRKENYLACLYLDAKGQLFLMSENADTALMQVVDVNERTDLVEAFSGLIARKISENTPAPVDFILGAENDTPMRNVSLVKDAVREVYGRLCGGVSKERNASPEEVKEEFPLSITFTSLQANDPEGVVRQVQSNPYFYWEQVQRYCAERNVDPKDLAKEFKSSKTARNLLVILINAKNQMLIQGFSTNWLKTSEEVLSEKSVGILKGMIVEMMLKNKNNPIFISLQTDVAASAAGVVHLISNTIPVAYEEAVREISEKENISFNQLMVEKPLLFIDTTPRAYSKDSKPAVRQIEWNRNSSVIRISTQKENQEEMAYFRAVVHDNEEDAGIVAIGLKALSGDPGDENIRQELVFGTPLEPVDAALVSVGAGLSKRNVESVKRMLDKKFQPEKSYFVLSL